jgi:hypothetical protein
MNSLPLSRRRLAFGLTAPVLAVAALFLAGPAVSTAFAGDQDFTLVNQTGVEIHNVHIAPHDSDEWGDDILGKDTLENGDSVHITFSRKEKAAKWDLRVSDKEGNSLTWENLNLLEISKVILHYKNGKGTAEVE